MANPGAGSQRKAHGHCIDTHDNAVVGIDQVAGLVAEPRSRPEFLTSIGRFFAGRKSKGKIAPRQQPTTELRVFWQVFALLDHFRRQHFLNRPCDPRLAAYTGALQFGIGGFPAFNVLRAPADQNASDAPPGFFRHHGHSKVG